MNELLSNCKCAHAFKIHDLTFTMAECTMLWVEHFGRDCGFVRIHRDVLRGRADVAKPGGGNYGEMVLAVANKVGWHHVIADVNELRTTKPDYIGGSVYTWGGFCMA